MHGNDVPNLAAIDRLTEVPVLPYDNPGDVQKLKEEGERVDSRVGAYTCYGNSVVLAKLISRTCPGTYVAVVGGFAIRQLEDGTKCVQAHAWVRIGDVHYDCTWPLWKKPINVHRYFWAFQEPDLVELTEHTVYDRICAIGEELDLEFER